jgi:hypothetical protein
MRDVRIDLYIYKERERFTNVKLLEVEQVTNILGGVSRSTKSILGLEFQNDNIWISTALQYTCQKTEYIK